MAVRQTTTAPRCKICQHERRSDIEALLEMRSRGESDHEGNRVNEKYVLAALERMGVVNPTKENITVHFKKHCEVVDEETAALEEGVAAKVAAEKLRLFEELLPGWPERQPTPDQEIELLRALYIFELRERVAAGLPANITHDQYRAILGESTKRRANEAQQSILGQLGEALGRALSGGDERPAIQQSVEAEYVEEDE